MSGDVERVEQDAIQDDRVGRLIFEQLCGTRARGQVWLHERIVAGCIRDHLEPNGQHARTLGVVTSSSGCGPAM